MIKPDGWDTAIAQEHQDFTKLPAGGYVCKVVDVEEKQSKSGRQMLVFSIDIAAGQFRDYFENMYSRIRQNNPDAKWPMGGTYYQLTEGDFTARFKGMINIFQKSNSPFYWNWDEKYLIGKLIGFVFREEEYLTTTGDVRTSVKPAYFAETEKINAGKFRIPEIKKLPANSSPFGGTAFAATEDDIPF